MQSSEYDETTFQSRLVMLTQSVFAYADIKPKSSVALIVIHEHFGLNNYLRVVVQALTSNQFSLIMPNLFEEDEEKDSNQPNSDAKYLCQINQKTIAKIIIETLEFVAKTHKNIVLMGFSLGSAIGLKILQIYKNVKMGIFFYGFPPPKSIQAKAITCQTLIFVGKKDKVKYLSDSKTVELAKAAYEDNNLVEIIQIDGDHGFMNPSSQNFSSRNSQFVANKINEKLQILKREENIKEQKVGEASEGETINEQLDVKKEEGGCLLI